ncbi:hypothetical protein ACMHYC_10885 [Acinetobacter courvalinii]|uniref:hypothetical protein n=1 Tax=Acinetobacter courvalinii TaxID=280147 RepID=UPI0039C963E7
MRSEFSKWFEQYELNIEYAAEQIAKDAYELGLQSRQTEVDEITQLYAKELFNKKIVAKKSSEKLAELQLQNDELQKQLIDQGQRFNDQAQHIKDLEHKNGEMQKKITELKEIINENNKHA